MKTRRIVIAPDAAGQPTFAFDGNSPRHVRFESVPGFEAALHWTTEPGLTIPKSMSDPAPMAGSWVPKAGGTNIMTVTFPPDSVMATPSFDPVAAGAEYGELLPGLAEKFERDHPGMHTTDTVDYAIMIAGELHLELGTGETTRVTAGDIVIQNGTRHAWRNKSDKPGTIVFVLIGAARAQ